jgi:protein-L-isoaspartate(D-aspartate) O-methyltransferase
MSNAAVNTDLRHMIGEDRKFQRRFWLVQRISWILGLTLLIAACAGLMGSGGWFETVTISSGQHKIEYPRAFRWDADSEIIISTASAIDDEVRVEMGENFAKDFQLRQMAPLPSATKTANGKSLYFFPTAVGAKGMIIWHVRPIRPRIAPSYSIRVGDNPEAQLRPVIWP